VPETRRARRTGLALACMTMLAIALAQDGGPAAFDQLDTVVIVGERTPPLWKLTKKGHVVWILGTFRPQPRNVQINSQRLDQLIASSQEVIFPGTAYVSSAGFSAMSEVVKSDRNPGGATLRTLLPAEAYAKWLELRQKYAPGSANGDSAPKFEWGANDSKWVVLTRPYRGGDGIDALRPTFAWEGLRRAAMDRYALASYDLESVVGAIAKKHNVPARKLRPGRELIFVWTRDPVLQELVAKNANPAELLGNLDYGDADCLSANLDLLEPFMEMRRTQAAAWARGDLAALQSADTGLRLRDCVTELVAAAGGGRLPASTDGSKAQDRYYRAYRDSNREVQKGWVSAMQDAVRENEVTFTVVPIDLLLEKDGYLAALRDKGFVLEE
jgi:hypothetical protein